MISIIICSRDPQRFNAVRSMYGAALGAEPSEIVGVHDAPSLAEGYNGGVAASHGDILIFSHDDVEVLSPNFVGRLKAHLSRFDIVGVAGTSRLIHPQWTFAGPPHLFGQIAHVAPNNQVFVDIFGAPCPIVGNIQAMDGVFFAANRPVLSQISFDAATFDGFHAYDVDFTYAAHRAGFKLAVACDINLLHASIGNFADDWQKYGVRFHHKWLAGAPSPPLRKSHWAGIFVATKADAMEVMTPPHWQWPSDNAPSHQKPP